MNSRSRAWFEKAVAKGVSHTTAYMGAEVIDSWADFWNFEIPDDSLNNMLTFALSFPEAALHRWSIMAGPRPYLPSDDEIKSLRDDPKYSILDSLAEQRSRKQ